MNTTLSQDQINRIVYADHHDPFEVLGAHVITLAVTVDGERDDVRAKHLERVVVVGVDEAVEVVLG